MTNSKSGKLWAALALAALMALSSCSTESSDEVDVNPVTVPASSKSYIVLAWNDLGMHCLNPTYDKAVILPPYNTVWAQVIKRGNPPRIVDFRLDREIQHPQEYLAPTASEATDSSGTIVKSCSESAWRRTRD